MAVKFKESKVRLWEGIGKRTNCQNIAIKFHKSVDKEEIMSIRETIESILTLKYGKGIK
jgi:hypothetical protein